MNKVSSVLVRHRNRIFLFMAAFTLLNLILMFRVKINSDMTFYLPDNSPMRQGIDILAEEMQGLTMTNSVRVVFKNLHEDPLSVKKDLSSLEGVSSVSHKSGSTFYEKEDYTLFVLNCTCGYHSPEMTAIVKSLKTDFAPLADNLLWALDDTSRGQVPKWIIAIAILLIVIILVTMSSSWFESFLFLIAIGMAILINMGTNILKGQISDITFTIAALLQLVLSMDYSIILMNRFRQELAKPEQPDPETAMKNAISAAFSSISSSSLTTVVGLLAMVFMSFKIGSDLGVVLAKGVFISMVCILTVLPALILFCYPLIIKTPKKAPAFSFIRAGRLEYQLRYFLLAGFLLLFAAVFMLKGNTDISFTMTEPSAVDRIFPKSNSIILMYSNEGEEAAAALAEQMEAEEAVISVTSYATTLGKTYTPASLAQDAPSLLSSDLMSGMDLSLPDGIGEMSDEELTDLCSLLCPILFYEASGMVSDDRHLTMKQILTFLDKEVASASWAPKLLPAETIAQIQGASLLLGGVLGEEAYTYDELFSLIKSFYPGMTPSVIILLFDLYDSYEKAETLPEMTLEDLLLYLGNQFPDDQRIGPLVPAEAIEILEGIGEGAAAGRSALIGPAHSLMMLSTTLPDEAPETMAFMDRLNETLADTLTGEYYLLGNTPMAYEMTESFGAELTKMTLITAIAIFIVVLITFRSILIPAVLVLLIQTAVYATMVIINLQGYSIFYLALLMVQCILMGATIDYAILYTGYYREFRRTMGKKEALSASYRGSMHTIMTSGLIIVLITWILGYAFPNPAIGEICFTISKGATCSLVLIILLLPGILSALDRWICKPTNPQ